MNTRYYWGTLPAKQVLKAAFEAHKAILAESDTIWGLFTPVCRWGAAELDKLKGRRDKPYLVIMDSLESVLKTVILSDRAQALVTQFWPGPLTILARARAGELEDATSSGIIGIRVPAHEALRAAAHAYGGLFSTSANLTGEPTPTTIETIPDTIRTAVGAVLYNAPSYKTATTPSTIVDCTGDTIKIVRHGALTMADLELFL